MITNHSFEWNESGGRLCIHNSKQLNPILRRESMANSFPTVQFVSNRSCSEFSVQPGNGMPDRKVLGDPSQKSKIEIQKTKRNIFHHSLKMRWPIAEYLTDVIAPALIFGAGSASIGINSPNLETLRTKAGEEIKQSKEWKVFEWPYLPNAAGWSTDDDRQTTTTDSPPRAVLIGEPAKRLQDLFPYQRRRRQTQMTP